MQPRHLMVLNLPSREGVAVTLWLSAAPRKIQSSVIWKPRASMHRTLMTSMTGTHTSSDFQNHGTQGILGDPSTEDGMKGTPVVVVVVGEVAVGAQTSSSWAREMSAAGWTRWWRSRWGRRLRARKRAAAWSRWARSLAPAHARGSFNMMHVIAACRRANTQLCSCARKGGSQGMQLGDTSITPLQEQEGCEQASFRPHIKG